MIPSLRQQQIVDLLRNENVLYLPDLVKAMGISESTLRRDLKVLVKEGQISLMRGGAVSLPQQHFEIDIEAKLKISSEEKSKIARYAARLIYPGDVIFLDPSSTNYLMIDYIQNDRVTVVTNSLSNINKLIKLGFPTIMIGGTVKPNTNSCIGSLTESLLRSFRFSKCFLGATGICPVMGITNHDPSERAVKRIAIECSASTYFLIDASKVGVTAMCKVADVDECNVIIDRPVSALAKYDNITIAE